MSTTSTICIACLIYTLEDKPVKDNLYIPIFYLWLSKLIQSGGLTANDMVHIHIDTRTMAYLENEYTPFPLIIERLPCPYVVHLISPPKTSLHGMMNKYNSTEYTQDVYIYCDIDIVIINPISTMIQGMAPDMLYLCAEGPLTHPNYSNGFPDDFPISDAMIGFSAGKFAITGKALRNEFFDSIRKICDYSTSFYTVEQPFFNRAAYTFGPVDTELLASFVSFNGDYYDISKTIFHDLAGNPGNGLDHLKRIVDHLSLYLCGFYS